ncbi:hypothetical protein CPG37_12565 [Malaciobacter canalis]|uniref:YtkA-like domain-containing protein n=1 Tax=Malaciobacter canalis TaxID=1912871 RepID=A0ABX4LMR9_9BACT|nr:hypothetical protein [Malaciobacter canalis]PHO08818.1 hypothetical protein CPG37_12565 [Malaciobacter canalis]QEE31881.1 putative cytochrome c oxidase-associated protein CcoH [Malaciobacter canalis]
MKRNYWPLFFIGIFSFAFSLIVWTIYSAVQVPVHEDDTFFKKYQDVDMHYNDIIRSNDIFLSKYDFKITINNQKFDLDTKDIFLSQRVIEKSKVHKDILHVGKNSIKIDIYNKAGNVESSFDINLRVTESTNNNTIIDLNKESFSFLNNSYNASVDVPKPGKWNIIATFEKDGNKGYFFLKTNAN